MQRKVAQQGSSSTVFKTPEKKQPVPRDYSPGKKPVLELVFSEADFPKLKLFWVQLQPHCYFKNYKK